MFGVKKLNHVTEVGLNIHRGLRIVYILYNCKREATRGNCSCKEITINEIFLESIVLFARNFLVCSLALLLHRIESFVFPKL